MFKRFSVNDSVLDQTDFAKDEVQYNLIYRISEYEDAVKIKSDDEKLIFTQSAGHNPWLWISQEIDLEQRRELIQKLVEYVKDQEFPGVSAEPETAQLFAESFCEFHEQLFHTYMMLEAYHCLVVKKSANVGGYLRLATEEYSTTIAGFMAGFSEDAFGRPVQPVTMLPMAKEAASSGRLYLWIDDDIPVSMANIAHQTSRHARINDVYTPRTHRKKGYASAIVAELCSQLLHEEVTPMLYADAKNRDSNKVYQSIGFVEAGRIADIKFDLRP
ncbi:GNAT family N-acetyltransferase [Paenibacillus sp. FSL K6-0276]|uniref:GNAT family N-acetyltransferase n=1 Tax=Paenibacillus sp. FSL K6-0276 TaxID=2921450 RepID=UPI0030EF4FB4